ncbi:MAG TPA: hypothetical protein VIX19_11365 [Terriglobales bacterium]
MGSAGRPLETAHEVSLLLDAQFPWLSEAFAVRSNRKKVLRQIGWLMLLTMYAPVRAQWLHYPTAGVPELLMASRT